MILTVQEGVGEVKYGTLIKKVFKLTDDQVSRVHYWYAGCTTCTEAAVNVEDKELEVVIDTTKIGAVEGQLHMLHKTVDLFLDPKVPQFIADENLKQIPNPDKDRITFILTGRVE